MSAPQKYRPKIVEFEAMGPISPDNQDEIAEWCNGRAETAHLPGPGRGVTKGVRIRTLDGPVTAPYGHYVFRCTDGSFAPCAPEFFAATYEAVTE